METTPNRDTDYQDVLERSMGVEGPMGAIAFAVLEMFRRGGLEETEVEALHERMKRYFMVPSNAECNAIIRMVETRLQSEKVAEPAVWYREV